MGSPSPVGDGWSRAGGALLLAVLGAGALATVVGAARYPGGTWVDPGSPGHSFWGNFLCDIARDVAVNGRPNPGAPWGRAAEWTFVLAVCLFWWLAPALLAAPRWRLAVPALGTLSTLGLLLVPVTVDAAHALALVAGAGPGLAAAGLVVHGLRARPLLTLLGAVALLLAALELGLYLAFRRGPLPIAVPGVQRLALLAAVAWMAGCAATLLRAHSSIGSPRAT